MQISTARGNGLISIATGTNRVIATSALADWSAAIAGNSWFTLIGDNAVVYTIQALYPPTTPTTSGFWEADLVGIYSLPSLTDAPYAITKDFTTNWNLPLFAPGDVQRSQIQNRASWIIDAHLGSGSGGAGGGPSMLIDFTLPTLTLPKPSLFWKIVVQDGQTVLEWWLLQSGAPASGDTPTSDDSTSRWRRVG